MAKYLDGEGLKLVVKDYDGKIDKKVTAETGKQLIETTKVTKLDGIEEGAQVNEITEANLESKVTGKGFAKSSEIPTDYLTDEDLTDYAKTTDIPSLDGYAKSTDIPDVSGKLDSSVAESTYATKTENGLKQDKSSLGTDVAGLGFIKEDALSGLAKSTDIPDVSGKVDRTELNNYVTKAENESAMHYCGEVQSESDLTAKEATAKQGDFYNVKDDDINRMWNGTTWDKMAPKVDISGKADRTDLPEALSTQEIQAIIAGE